MFHRRSRRHQDRRAIVAAASAAAAAAVLAATGTPARAAEDPEPPRAAAKVTVPETTSVVGSVWEVIASSPETPEPSALVTVNSGRDFGDVDFAIGDLPTTADLGVLMGTVRQNGLRTNGTASDARYGGVESPWNSGFSGTASGLATFNYNTGTEWNVDVAVAYFPYARFRGGYYVYETQPNGTLAGTLKFSDVRVPGAYSIQERTVPLPSIVKYGVNLDGSLAGGNQFGQGNQQFVNNLAIAGRHSQLGPGLLFVMSAIGELTSDDNFANATPLVDGSWTVAVRDADHPHYGGPDTFERDPFNFLYLEQADLPTSVAARVLNFDAANQPVVAQTWGGYTLVRKGRGLYDLSIAGGPTFTVEQRGHHLIGDLLVRDADTDGDGVIDQRTFVNTQDLVQLPFDGSFSFAYIPLDEEDPADGVLLLAGHEAITLADGTVAPLPRWLTYQEGGVVQWTGNGPGSAWATDGNWDGPVPTGPESLAYFLGADADAGAVSLSASGSTRIVGTLRFENPLPYVLQGVGLQVGDTLNHGTIEVVEGSHTIAAPVSAPGGLTINGAVGAGILTVQNIRGTRLNLNNAKVLIAANGGDAGTSFLTQLNITPASQLDLNDNHLALNYNTAAPFPEPTLRGWLRSGFNAGAWDGGGIASLAANLDPLRITAIGSAPAGEILDFSVDPILTWAGVPVDATTALLKHTYYGDTNLDEVVGPDDYLRADTGFMSRFDADPLNHLFGWLNGDFNYDGLIDAADYYLMDRAFALQPPPPPPPAPAGAAAVPEPAGCAGALLAGLGLLARRRRRSRA